MKKIVIYIQKGVNPIQKLWAKEATQDFLGMFPEYQNSFKIEFTEDDIEQLVVQATDPKSGKIDASKLTEAQNNKLEAANSTDIAINLVKGTFVTEEDGEILYGLTIGNSFSISGASSSDEDLFKAIFVHEMGHIFNATTKERSNTKEDKEKGVHCTNPLCLMGDDHYDLLAQEYKQRKKNGNPPFCNDCIAAIRRYLEQLPDLKKEIILEEFIQTLLPEPHNDNEWKRDLRAFYQSVAQRDGFTYKEDRKSSNYMAKIVRTDGSSLSIEANNEYHVALGANDDKGASDIPSLKDMRDLVKYTQSKNSGMAFGKDNEPEFNARLMIACLEAKPEPLKMRNQPKIDEAFLGKLKPETKRHLKILLNSQNQQNIPTPARSR